MICFVVPVQQLDTARDAALLRRVVQRTIGSVTNQLAPEWRLVVVAGDAPEAFGLGNAVADPRVSWQAKCFPYDGVVETPYRYSGFTQTQLRGLRDKGRKSLWGSRMALQDGVTHVMSVDSDDLVSNRLAGLCRSEPDAPGWWMESGWGWSDTSSWLIERIDHSFSSVCGSSNIVNVRVFGEETFARSFDDPSIEECGWWLPHGHIRDRVRQIEGCCLPLPFRGAVYVRHGSNMTGRLRGRARSLVRSLLRGCLLSRRIRQEFLGSGCSGAGAAPV